MREKILLNDKMQDFISFLKNEHNLYAPVNEAGNISFKNISSWEEIDLEYLNSKIPPKEVVFPQIETLFEFKINGNDIQIEPPKHLDEKNIIFGIRPCDARALKFLNFFFNQGDFKDELFSKKMENTILIGMGCNTPRSTCFCTSLEGHPFREEDSDVFLVDLGKKFLVKPITEKGENLIEAFREFSEPKKEDLEKASELARQAEGMITKLELEDIPRILDENFNHPIWKKISEACLSCGTCAYLCPTCHCFDVIDEKDEYTNRGRRIRMWDTCQFKLYTLHTSGHNPRPKKLERCRNRILHKYCYYPKNYGMIGCVGCGRCIELCPANNDIRKIIKNFKNIEEKEKMEEITVA